MEQMNETACEYVSSRGILKSCDIHNPNPVSSSSYLDASIYGTIQSGQTVYLCTEAIPYFLKTYLPSIQGSITIVSGDSDLTFPTNVFKGIEWKEVLENPKIKHWFAQNCIVQHPKLTSIPIGLDYHTIASRDHPWGKQASPVVQEKQIKEYASIVPKLSYREHRAYGNYLENISRGNRRDAYASIPKNLVIYENGFVPRHITWWKQASAAFTISPHGNGLDCHRTWETLVLGGIPIVQTSMLDILYEGLPVLIVKEWSDITKDLLETTIREFELRTFEKERLTLQYWLEKIKKTK